MHTNNFNVSKLNVECFVVLLFLFDIYGARTTGVHLLSTCEYIYGAARARTTGVQDLRALVNVTKLNILLLYCLYVTYIDPEGFGQQVSICRIHVLIWCRNGSDHSCPFIAYT